MSGFAWETEAEYDAELLARSFYPMAGRYVAFPTESYGYIVRNTYGMGSSIYISGTLGEVYNVWCNPDNRKMIARRLSETADPLTISNAPQSVEISLRKQLHTGNLQVHLVNMTRGPGRPMEETIRVYDITVELTGVKGKKAYGIYTGREYNIFKTDKGTGIEIPFLDEYEVIIVEQEES